MFAGANFGEIFSIELFDARTPNLGIDDVLVDTFEEAEKAISKIDEAIQIASSQRAKFGFYQNGLEHSYNNVSNSSANLNNALSRIEDTDIAKEVMGMTRNSIIH